jgi:hypothetical protein
MSISSHSISHYYWEQIHKLHFIILRVHLLQRRKEGNTHKRLSLSPSPQANKKAFVSRKRKLMVAVETNFFNQPTNSCNPQNPPNDANQENARRRRRRVVIVKRAPIHIRYTHNLETQNSET